MIKRLVFIALTACLLAACGNKGALVLPDKPAPADAPQASVDTPAPQS